MNMPRIENSDRGITLNKTLAWSMAVSLAIFLFWAGRTVQGMDSSVATLAVAVAEQDAEQADARHERGILNERLKVLEIDKARFEEWRANMLTLTARIDKRLERIEQSWEGRP